MKLRRTTDLLNVKHSALFADGLAAILASTCCLGPLVLIAVGIPGAWISNLTLLEPYRPVFIGTAPGCVGLCWTTHLPSRRRDQGD